MIHYLRGLLSICTLACCVCRNVDGGNPSLEQITPSVGTRGTTFAVTARGASLKNVQHVLFYERGVRCERVETKTDEEAKLHLVTDVDCSLGPHAFRLLGNNGFSELRTLTISPFPTVQEDIEAEKQFVQPNCTVLGTLEADDVDSFLMNAKAGERISAEAVGVRLGVSLLDTTLTLRDPSGRILTRVDDTPLLNQDPCFSILAPEDGNYLIEITTAGANADAESRYALHLGNFPRPFSVFPLGARAGIATEVMFTSSDGSQVDAFQKNIPFDSGLIGTRLIELTEGGLTCPSPIPFRISTFDQVCNEVGAAKLGMRTGMESELAGTTQTQIIAPVAVHGIIREAGEVDWFTFGVHQNGNVSLEVYASRLGSLLDAVVEVRDQTGNVVSSGDDFDSHDTRLVFETHAEMNYSVSIRDKRGNSGYEYGYCIEVSTVQPSITAFLPRRDKLSQTGQTIAVPKGNRTLGFLGVRRDRLDGEVALAFEGLPYGVSIDCPRIAKTEFVVPAVFSARESAEIAGSLVRVRTALQSGITELTGEFEQVVDLVNGPADAIFQCTRLDRLAVAATNPVPYSIEIEKLAAPLFADGTLEIAIEIKREVGFDGPIDITLPLLPEWVDCQPKTRIASKQNFARITLRANRNAKASDWPLVAEGEAGLAERSSESVASSTGMRSPRQSATSMANVCTSLHSLSVSDSPVRGIIDSISAEQGSKVEIVCRLEMGDWVPETLTATLEDLPNRVHVEAIRIGREDKEVKFQLEIADDAPIGIFDSVVCRLSGALNGQNVSYYAARNTKLIISAPGKSQKDESGRPLSPLEALRRKTKQRS